MPTPNPRGTARSRSIVLAVIAWLLLTWILSIWTDRSMATVAVAVGASLVVFRLGLAMIRGLAQPTPEPPEPGELRKVKLTYRCELCGMEIRMTMAPHADPEPPRHCQEPMTLVTPID